MFPSSDHSLQVFLRRFSRWIGAAVVLIGCLVLVGWQFNIPALRSLKASYVTMKANTALAFVLSGLSLYFSTGRTRRKSLQLFTWTCSILVVLVGFLSLMEYITGLDFHIDQLLYLEASDAVGTSHPGRMAPATALSFFIIGVNLALLNSVRFEKVIQLMTLVVGFMALLAVSGYAYGVQNLYNVASRTQMALHTSLTFVVLCVGMLCGRPDVGVMRIAADEGIAGVLVRRLLPAAMAAHLALGWLQMEGQKIGLYGLEFERALSSVTITIVAFALTWWASASLKKTDDERKKIAGSLQKSHEELEHRVAERTTELLQSNEKLKEEMDERKKAEESLRESRAKYRELSQQFNAVLEAIPDSLSLVSPDLKILWANRSAVETMAEKDTYDPGGICHKLWHGRTLPCEPCPLQTVVAGGEMREFVVTRDEGSWEFRLIPIKDESGSVTSVVRLARDVSATRRLEAQLRESQKLEAVGTLAGGIAHDFNNILSPIIGYTEMVLEEVKDSVSLKRHLEQVLTAAHRAKDLVRQILTFSRRRQEASSMAAMDISTIVKEALKLLRASLPSSIEIRQSIERGVAEVDATQIHQVIVNLCTNAAHAMDGKGILEVSLSRVVLGESESSANILSSLAPGPYLKLAVSDTGHGMSGEVMQRIFEPYFTTKETGKGTGLGLSMVHGIVKKHGGEVAIRSKLGEGSSFDVYLPVVAVEARSAVEYSEPLPKGSERILLVDDERAIVDMAARMLEQLGYRTTARTSPVDALSLFRTDPHRFDLIITDYTMPHMTGTDLTREILEIRPDIPIIVCTGYSEKVTESDAREFGIQGYAMKPLDKRQLAELVRRVLDGGKR